MTPDDAHCGQGAPLDTAPWYQAREATAQMRDVLTSAGLQHEFPYLRADLNAFGQGLVVLGRISPETAQRIAELLRLGLDAVRVPPTDEQEDVL
jgi:hypothetical protein